MDILNDSLLQIEQIRFLQQEIASVDAAIEGLRQHGAKYEQSISELQQKVTEYRQEMEKKKALYSLYQAVQQWQQQILAALDTKLGGSSYYKPTVFSATRHQQKVQIVKELHSLASMSVNNLIQLAECLSKYRQLCTRHVGIEPSTEDLEHGGGRLGGVLRLCEPVSVQSQLDKLVREYQQRLVWGLKLLDNQQSLHCEAESARVLTYNYKSLSVDEVPIATCHTTQIVEAKHHLASTSVTLLQAFNEGIGVGLQRASSFLQSQIEQCAKDCLYVDALLHIQVQLLPDGNEGVGYLVRREIIRRFLDTLLCKEQELFYKKYVHSLAERKHSPTAFYITSGQETALEWYEKQCLGRQDNYDSALEGLLLASSLQAVMGVGRDVSNSEAGQIADVTAYFNDVLRWLEEGYQKLEKSASQSVEAYKRTAIRDRIHQLTECRDQLVSRLNIVGRLMQSAPSQPVDESYQDIQNLVLYAKAVVKLRQGGDKPSHTPSP